MTLTALKLSSPVTDVPRIGPAKAKVLKRLSITHVRDFLYTFPHRYDDFSRRTPIVDLREGEKMTVRGRVRQVHAVWGWRGRRRVLRIFVDIEDPTGVLAVTWYNLRFLPRQLWRGRELYVAGTVERHPDWREPGTSPLPAASGAEGPPGRRRASPATDGGSLTGHEEPQSKWRMRSPVIEFVSPEAEQTHTGRITPVYPETEGVTSRFLRYHVKNLLPLVRTLPEYLPDVVRARYHLMGIHEALRLAHFPADSEALERARQRLRFDELFFLQLAALLRRGQLRQVRALPIPPDRTALDDFVSALPFTLTPGQEQALQDIVADLSQPRPMHRLLQGDVGSGKSVVALAATYLVLEAGASVVYLAPTEILARQQATYFAAVLGRRRVALLIGATTSPEKARLKQALPKTGPRCVVGTHALLQGDVRVHNCALTIIDEQHRFGVAQRAALQAATRQTTAPHLLSMTATPIPRTLSLTVYGDLDISVLRELPPGRQAVVTAIVAPAQRAEALAAVGRELIAGHQAFVIAPLITKSERLQVRSAQETYGHMQRAFPRAAVGLLHSQLPSAEKERMANHFASGAIQLLVSTAVVEVGVNVPNATIMIIEGAERFGLAQLHQLRGRVGRAEHQSYCYLLPTTEADVTNARLQALCETTDGFVIAERDLQLRGPGEVYGVAQSGFGDLQVASLLDLDGIRRAREAAQMLLRDDPTLDHYPILKAKAERKNLVTHFE